MPYWENGHMDAGWGVAMGLGMLGVWVLIGLIIVWALRSSRAHAASVMERVAGSAPPTPQQILAERLAHGDIDPDDYRSRLAALSATR